MAYIYDLSDTWNASGTAFYGIKMNVTNTASASGSKLLSLQVASTEYFGVDKDGNVTIGNGGDLRLSSATGGDASIIYNDAEDLYFNTNGAVRAVINSSGNVGIGTSSPLSRFTVSQTGTATISLESAGAWNSGIGVTSGGSLVFYNPLATERMRIDSSGNVGIGTSAPGQKLDVTTAGGDDGIALNNSSTTGGRVRLNSTGTGGRNYHITSTADGSGDGGGKFIIRDSTASDAARLAIDASGNVGIGVTGPSGRLDVRAASGPTAVINSYNDSTTGNVYSYFSNLQNTGNSTSSYHYAGVTQGVNIWYLYGNGTSSWSSDYRLKKNIESTRDGYLDDICKLRVVKYNWHTDAEDKPRELGLIAQEVEEVFPGLVEEALHTLDDTEIKYKVLKGSVLPYMLLKALQEAATKIDALTARVAELEGK